MKADTKIIEKLAEAGRVVREKFVEMSANSERYAEDVFLRKPVEPNPQVEAPRPR